MKNPKRMNTTHNAQRAMGAKGIYGFTCSIFPRFPTGR
jgi:hypothetical protein